MKNIITLAGDPGAGKTEVGKLLAENLNWELINIGKLQRELAAELGMDVQELNQHMVIDRKYDDMLDGKIKDIGQNRTRGNS
ncbi:MAG: cytidylate kinase family protein [Bacteroidales bacterium]|nr:cytidylate kinase family protein [Bacteroidales bacterium]